MCVCFSFSLFLVFPLIFFLTLFLFRHARASLAAGRDEAGTAAAMDQQQRGFFRHRSVGIIFFIIESLTTTVVVAFLPFRPARRPRRDPEAADLQPRRDRLPNHPHGAQAR